MSKWIIFTKDDITNKHVVSFLPENDMEAKVMISELNGLNISKYLLVEVADNIDPKLLEKGTELNKEIFKSHLECMNIEPLAFATAFTAYYLMSPTEGRGWIEDMRNA